MVQKSRGEGKIPLEKRTYVRYNVSRKRWGGDNVPVYICIDLKSFYASVECVCRGLDPMTTNLVVADPTRSESTICLAITPAMKKLGIKNRCRVFQIPKGIEFIQAKPRMKLYIEYSARIYSIYLRFFDKSDIHVYSIDEVFIEATKYMAMYNNDPVGLAKRIINQVYRETGIRATCGIGTNLYLAKVGMDILAKHSPDGLAVLDEESYCQRLWDHAPITDFWRIGNGTARHLERYGIYTMGQLAMADRNLIMKAFGVDGELLMDHAWGRENTTLADIKGYVPKLHSLSSGQVLFHDYTYDKAKLIVKEMTELMTLDLVKKKLVTDSVGLYIGYSNKVFVPPAKGTLRLPFYTSSGKIISEHMEQLYEEVVSRDVGVRRVNISFNNVVGEENEQFDFFTSTEELAKEKNMMKAINAIKDKYGKNSMLKGMNFEEGGTTIERNNQIGGHKA